MIYPLANVKVKGRCAIFYAAPPVTAMLALNGVNAYITKTPLAWNFVVVLRMWMIAPIIFL